MLKLQIGLLSALFIATLPASAQVAKEIRTKKGASVILLNLLNAKPDCSSEMNPVGIPVIQEKPSNGTLQMTLLVANVAASGNCGPRKVPVISLIYTPNREFVGSETVAIEINSENRATVLRYRISVLAPGESL
ncbi:hypothetical protein [Bradyrhizobium sp. MOS002]|uniref:hypothetical protein n=1 Tax=Bradyrhizobium sp. MOS002 TaxID=2133947 RepID=UPI0011B1EFBD|nr:hypothetical protein [Bradyrhizobium sp. MOS002]